MDNGIFEIYKNSVMPHGKHIFNTEYDMDTITMCAYPPSEYAWPHWKSHNADVSLAQELFFLSSFGLVSVTE